MLSRLKSSSGKGDWIHSADGAIQRCSRRSDKHPSDYDKGSWTRKGNGTGVQFPYFLTELDGSLCTSLVKSKVKDSIVNCDETWCKVRKYDHYKKCYIWVLVNKARKTAIFFYENGSRGRDVLTDFLGDAELKSIMSDGYNAYVFIGNELKSARFKDTVHQVVCLMPRTSLSRLPIRVVNRVQNAFPKF